jgi:hypothetical protein
MMPELLDTQIRVLSHVLQRGAVPVGFSTPFLFVLVLTWRCRGAGES